MQKPESLTYILLLIVWSILFFIQIFVVGSENRIFSANTDYTNSYFIFT